MTAVFTAPDSPRTEISRRPVLTEREKSDICLSYSGTYNQYLPTHWDVDHYLAYKVICLPDLIGRLLQPSLRSIDSPVALIDILLHVSHVIVLEAVFALVWGALVLRFQWLAMDFRTGAKILLGVCEEVVRTGAGQK